MWLLTSARKKILNNFKFKIFLANNLEAAPEPEPEWAVFVVPKPAKEGTKKSSYKFYRDFENKICEWWNKYKYWNILWIF